MDMRKCPVCGEMYSTTYRTCPFCAEDEAIKKGKPIHRNASDFQKHRGGGVLGVTILVLVLVLIGAGTVFFFGDNKITNPSSALMKPAGRTANPM